MAIRRFSSSRVTRKEDYASMAAQPSGELVWASVSGTSGSPSTGTYTSGDDTYDYYKFTGSGSITFSKGGVVDVMVVAGGAGGQQFSYAQGREYPDTMRQNSSGGSGGVVWKIVEVADGQTVAVGVGGGGGVQGNGVASSFGNLAKIGGGQTVGRGSLGAPGGGGQAGVTWSDRDSDPTLYGGGFGGTIWGSGNTSGVALSYDNSAIEYGISGGGASNRGNGGGPGSQAGGSGIVIVRIKK